MEGFPSVGMASSAEEPKGMGRSDLLRWCLASRLRRMQGQALKGAQVTLSGLRMEDRASVPV